MSSTINKGPNLKCITILKANIMKSGGGLSAEWGFVYYYLHQQNVQAKMEVNPNKLW